MMARKSAGDRPGFKSTSMPRRRKISTAAGESLSLIRTFGMATHPRIQPSHAVDNHAHLTVTDLTVTDLTVMRTQPSWPGLSRPPPPRPCRDRWPELIPGSRPGTAMTATVLFRRLLWRVRDHA